MRVLYIAYEELKQRFFGNTSPTAKLYIAYEELKQKWYTLY